MTFHHGDSAEVLPRLCQLIDEPAVFFLDAHWFERGGHRDIIHVADGNRLPLLAELTAIADRPPGDIVIVDDVHAFGDVDSALGGVTKEKILSNLEPIIEWISVDDVFVVWR